MKLEVPYYSQRLDVKDKDWQWRACGIVSLAMVMRFWKREETLIDNLIQEGVAINAYKKGAGWIHDGLLALARKRELHGYRKEWNILPILGILYIGRYLSWGKPVMASVANAFEKGRGGHLIVLVGVEGSWWHPHGFYYHDPDVKGGNGKDLFVNIVQFKTHWRRKAIFIEK